MVFLPRFYIYKKKSFSRLHIIGLRCIRRLRLRFSSKDEKKKIPKIIRAEAQCICTICLLYTQTRLTSLDVLI